MSVFPKHLVRENAYRDVWLFAVTVMVLLGLIAYNNRTNEIQQGRKATAGITCAVSAAVVNAGRLVIVESSEQPLPPRLESFLEHYGYPPKGTREAQAALSAQAYTSNINREVVKAAGVNASSVLEPAKLKNGKPNPAAGSLNCERLRALAKLK
jgi:hypothetical protein